MNFGEYFTPGNAVVNKLNISFQIAYPKRKFFTFCQQVHTKQPEKDMPFAYLLIHIALTYQACIPKP